ncbi:MAG: hypothetical protein ACREMD_15460 [Gemmatimonadota bacterium]
MYELFISDHYCLAETRSLGRAFYPVLLKWAESAPTGTELVVSFEDVEFVSPSFIDETLARFIQERPDLAARLRLASIDAFSLGIVRSTLAARGIQQDIPIYEPA